MLLSARLAIGPLAYPLWKTRGVEQILNDFGGIALAIAGVLVVGAGLIVAFLRPSRRSREVPPPPGAGSEAVLAPERPGAVPGAPPSPPATGPPAATGDDAAPAVTVEKPPAARGRMAQLRARLARSNTALGRGLLALLSSGGLDEETWQDVEDTLLAADLGVEASAELVEALRTRAAIEGEHDEATVREWLREELLRVVDPAMDRRIASRRVNDRAAVILVVGVNGTGKTTTAGKLARVMVAEDRDVLLGAADTFRAAAADQLTTWGERVGVPTVRSDREGADPASVAFEAVRTANEGEYDVVIIDTAGRLHNKANLMDELGKIKRVIEKQSPLDEVLLVLDATTGQNGLVQAQVFAEAVDITGIVLTKLDGTAKGGIVVAVQRKLGVPVKLVGLGEGPDDLAPFDPRAFVDALLT